jgi:phosphonoacetaldehyde hydrolase
MLDNRCIPPHTVAAQKLRALIFDWAGTTVDFGSLAPVRAIQKAFQEFGVPVDESTVRRDMGLPKRNHIAQIFSTEKVQAAWKNSQGALPLEADIERVYKRFIPLQMDALGEHSSVIDGVPEAIERARSRGLRIGSTTGYTRAMLDFLVTSSAHRGFNPDCSISPEDVGPGRPQPFMIFENAVRLQVYPLASIAKIGDTAADIEEGLNAGAWSIGVAGTGNMVGLTKADWDALADADRSERLRTARAALEVAGAHYVIDTLDQLHDVLDDINLKLRSVAVHT